MWRVIFNSIVAGAIFYNAYQFLFIGSKNRKYIELLIFGFIIFFQGFIALIELTGLNITDPSVSYMYQQVYFQLSLFIYLLFFVSVKIITKHDNKIINAFFVILILLDLINVFFFHSLPVFKIINVLIVLNIGSHILLAFKVNKNIPFVKKHFTAVNEIFFTLKVLLDVFIGYADFHITSYIYLTLITFISSKFYINFELAQSHKEEADSRGELLHLIIDLVPNLIFVKDKSGKNLLANEAFNEIHGISNAGPEDNPEGNYAQKSTDSHVLDIHDRKVLYSQKKVFIPEEKILAVDGEEKIFQTIKIPFYYEGSRAILGVSTDITALEQSRSKLKDNEHFLEAIFDSAPVAMILVDQDATLLKINKTARRLGFNIRDNLIGNPIGNVLNCIKSHQNENGCGFGKECSQCPLRNSIRSTFLNKSGLEKIPMNLIVRKEDVNVYFDIQLSTSYLESSASPVILLVLEDITSIISAENALIDSEFRYKQITRAITDYVYTLVFDEDEKMQIIHTPACDKITGYSAEEFETDPRLWYEIIYEDDRGKVFHFLNNQEISADKQNIEYRITCKDGAKKWVSNTLIIKKSKNNKVKKCDGVITDITVRKHAEEALENQNRLLNTMLDNLQIGIFMVSASSGKLLLANNYAKNLLGDGVMENTKFKNLDFVNKTFVAGTNDVFPFEKSPVVLGLKGIPTRIDNLEVEQKNGNRIFLEALGCPVFDIDNNIIASLVSFTDITDRRNSELALRESEKKLSIIFEYSPIGISLSDNIGNIEYMNPSFCQLLGYQPDHVLGKNFQLFTDEKDIEEEIKIFDKLRNKEKKIITLAKRYIRQDGQDIWVHLHVSAFRNIRDEVTNFIVMAEDITERKKSIDLLRASEEKFRNIFNTSNDAILITDFESRILEVNRESLNRTGYTLDEMINKRIIDFINPVDKTEAIHQYKVLQESDNFFLQTNYINRRDQKVYIEIIGHNISYNGKTSVLLVSRDITDRTILQQRILNAIIEAEEKERNHFSQELHDGIGPLLSTIKLYVQWIQSPESKSDKTELLSDALKTVEEAIVSVKEISSKLSPNILIKFGLETALQSFVKKISNLGKTTFHFNIKLKERIKPEIEAMLYRVFVESINNSMKYAKASSIHINMETKKDCLLTVYKDNGGGFDAEEVTLQKKGNGLFNMQNRVQTYEGSFSIISKPGKGTKILISIPKEKYLL